jgi:hypothetical protein
MNGDAAFAYATGTARATLRHHLRRRRHGCTFGDVRNIFVGYQLCSGGTMWLDALNITDMTESYQPDCGRAIRRIPAGHHDRRRLRVRGSWPTPRAPLAQAFPGSAASQIAAMYRLVALLLRGRAICV